MFATRRIYYTIEVKLEDDSYMFVCSYATYSEAKETVDKLTASSGNEYRILKIEKDIEEVQ